MVKKSNFFGKIRKTNQSKVITIPADTDGYDKIDLKKLYRFTIYIKEIKK